VQRRHVQVLHRRLLKPRVVSIYLMSPFSSLVSSHRASRSFGTGRVSNGGWKRPIGLRRRDSSPLAMVAAMLFIFPRRPALSSLHLIISAVRFKSDGQKSRIPFRLSHLLKSPCAFEVYNPQSKMYSLNTLSFSENVDLFYSVQIRFPLFTSLPLLLL
jgi:hypothetical protein